MIRRLLPAAAAVLLAAAALAAGALAGGRSPGVSMGWDGIATPAGEFRYVTLPAGRNMVLAAVRVDTGRVVRFRALRGGFGVPLVTFDGTAGGLSLDGRTLVLGQRPGKAPAAETRFAVLTTESFRIRRVFALRGDFSFDALSPDGRLLYLIEHVPAQDASRYRVRAYDLAAGRLLARVIADKREGTDDMAGYPMVRATSADGAWVYTLYRNDAGSPFVHALDARNAAAVCIDLPWQGSQDRLSNARLALSAGGKSLVLRYRSGTEAAVIDTTTFRIRVV